MSEISISIIMPAYNAEKYISEAIDSILNQTFRNFELLIIDDGSSDKTVNIIQSYTDSRIAFHQNEGNKGAAYTRKYGLRLAKGKYIAMMDADDVSMPTRLQEEYDFMELYPNISIVGSYFKDIGCEKITKHPLLHDDIKIQLLYDTTYGNSTVMMRASDIILNNITYDDDCLYAEDYGLWVNISLSQLKLANLPQILVEYRVHDGQLTSTRNQEQSDDAAKVRLKYASFLNDGTLTDADIEIMSRHYVDTPLEPRLKIIGKLKRINNKTSFFNKRKYKTYLWGLVGDEVGRVELMSYIMSSEYSLGFKCWLIKNYLAKVVKHTVASN